MDEQAYRTLLEKYLNKTASKEELDRLEAQADAMIQESGMKVFLSDDDKMRVKAELRERVTIKKVFKLPFWAKAAASVVLLVGLSLGIWFLTTQETGGEWLAVQTGPGEYKSLSLPDGSQVKLNALSTLEYPPVFDEKHRKVRITGEALFMVSKDAQRPFQVQSQEITTTVLGTQFNVNAYADDSAVEVSLLEGSVQVQGLGETFLMEPMQQSTFNLRNRKAEMGSFDSTEVMAWRKGEIVLSRTRFDQLQRLIKRRYGVEVLLKDPKMKAFTVSGKFKNPDLNTLLESICAAKSLHYKETAPKQFLIY